MKSFFEFYQTMQQKPVQPGQMPQQGQAMQQPQSMQPQTPQAIQQPQPGQGASQPVPAPEPNFVNGMKMLGSVKDPNFQKAWMAFQKQIQGLGIHVPGQQSQQNAAPQQAASPVQTQATGAHV